jgi:hypothetical protein
MPLDEIMFGVLTDERAVINRSARSSVKSPGAGFNKKGG